jgi:hypothetical protein
MTGGRSLKTLVAAVVALTVSGAVLVNLNSAFALPLGTRSIQLSTAVPSVPANENIQFFVPSASTLGSIAFEYCSNSPIVSVPCVAPAGLDALSASLVSQTGNTSFSVDNTDTTSNRLVISRLPLNASVIDSTYVFTGIVNPSTAGATTFVRITTYATGDATGAYTDFGAVAFATEDIFNVGAHVPPFIKLCVGISVSPNCSSISGDTVNLGVLSPNHANAGVSQFAAGTNSPTGYAVYSLGTTMTSGNNIISALTIPTTNFPGTQQFGINLRANLSPPVGQDPLGVGTATPAANYNTPNRFMFQNGDMLASSSLPSDYNRMSVSYLANVPPGQTPGIYTTTVTYVAIAQF